MNHSEFRKDLVSGEWILIAPGRVKRPHEFIEGKSKKRVATPKNKCPFEHPERDSIVTGGDLRVGKNEKTNWDVLAIENRFPSVSHQKKMTRQKRRGPFAVIPGTGHHELIITRDHNTNFPNLTEKRAQAVFELFQDRYRALQKDTNIAFISMFHNWGKAAGASVYHPHYQIIAIPVVPPDVGRSLRGSTEYFHEKGKCVHCAQITWERKEKKRIIAENEEVVAFAPFVSRNPFEVRIFPKRHLPYFEETGPKITQMVAHMLQRVLKGIEIKLGDPDYNFFIHTAPTKEKQKYPHYHWHIEIFPRFSIRAGFEFGTGIETNVIDPDSIAEMLR